MRGKDRKPGRGFFQLENEILIPFLIIGILVICSFAVISYYNGYSIKMKNEKNTAKLLLQEINWDMDYLYDKIGEKGLRDKYSSYNDYHILLQDQNQEWVSHSGITRYEDDNSILLQSTEENHLGWKVSYWVDKDIFLEELLEEQTYVVIGAIASLLVIIQASIFIAYNISGPIRSMSDTCREIDRNKGNYRDYHFQSMNRKDEIGQLATTFQNLLHSMDNYTKMDYTNRMASALAHEIKNPITGIRTGIQVLKKRVESPGDKMLCDSMVKEVDRVTALINNLFTLSVKKESVREIFTVKPVLLELELLYGIKIEFLVEEGLTCYANSNEMKQIFHNLISNSVRAILPGQEGKIVISGYEKNNATVLSLEDNGKGMTEEELKMAMEPFYTKSINGIGLGLAIVKKLVEQNRGSMKMESNPGKGTKTTLTFYEKGDKNEE